MCFTLFGITITISREVRRERERFWYAGSEQYDPERFLQESRIRADRLMNLF